MPVVEFHRGFIGPGASIDFVTPHQPEFSYIDIQAKPLIFRGDTTRPIVQVTDMSLEAEDNSPNGRLINYYYTVRNLSSVGAEFMLRAFIENY